MQTTPEIRDIQARASEGGVQIDAVLRRAKVAKTTWWRWSEGQFEPRLSTLRKVREALDAELREKRGDA